MGRNEAVEKLKTIIDDAMAEKDIVHKIATARTVCSVKTLGIDLLAKPYKRAQLAAAVEKAASGQPIN